MFSYIEGSVEGFTADGVILDNGGIGYEIVMPASDISRIGGIKSVHRIHTYFQVSENGIGLYGFLTPDEKEFFVKLISVNGVGPKAAIAILGVTDVSDLKFAILSDDEKTITRAPGVGPKLAKRIILDLKDKLDLNDAFEERLNTAGAESTGFTDIRNDCLMALTALGYSSSEVLKALSEVEIHEDMDVEALLKETLKHL